MAASEQKKSYATIKAFKGINTKANRTAIDEEEFAWLENAMPVGAGNLKITPLQTAFLDAGNNPVSFANTVTYLTSCNIGVSDYILAFEQDGSAEYVNITTKTKGTLAAAGTFSTTGVNVAQYKNERVIIGDPSKGLYSWDGTNLIAIGSVGVIVMNNHGTGYAAAPTVTLSAPNNPNGVQATAACTITTGAGSVYSVQVTNGGSGYTYAPQITFSPPQIAEGSTPIAIANVVGGKVDSITVISQGSGYTSAPTVSFSYGAATGTALLITGAITSIYLTNAGSGYTSPPTVSFSGGGGSSATALAQLLTFQIGTVVVNVTNNGSGYTTSPSVTFGDSSGTGAAATAILDGGQVSAVIMTNPGTGYSANTKVYIGSVGSVAWAASTAVAAGAMLTTSGRYYIVTVAGTTGTSAPTHTSGSATNGTATLLFVTVNDGGGTGATALAVPNTNPISSVQTFSGRVWVSSGRTVNYSAAGSYSDFTSVSAGTLTIADSTLHGNIQTMLSANNFMYVFGDDSINVFSDVRVSSSGTTLFTNTNVSASVGSKRKYAIFSYFRSVLFLNDYGVYALVGSTTSKLSDPLDGIFPLIDFTQPVSAGEVLLNNILCAAFSFTYKDPIAGPRQLQAVFFEKKWFFTSQGSLSYITSVPISGLINLYGVAGTSLYQLYADTSSNINSTITTALLPMGDSIRTKQALKFGIEATLTNAATINVTVDSEYNSSPSYTLTNNVQWINDANAVIPWQNNSSTVLNWVGTARYALYKSDAQQYGKYLGLTVTSQSPAFTINTFEFEHELRVRF